MMHLSSAPTVAAVTSGRAFWIDSKASYFQSDNALIDVAARHITAYGVAVFTCIERHAKFQTGEACPTIELIMAELGISEPTACKYVALLESCGMIEKRQTNWGNREQGPKSRNFYRVLPASKWSFLGLEKQVKAAPKSLKVAPKQIKPYKKNLNKKNVVQESTNSARAENVVADSKESVSDPLICQLVEIGVSKKVAAALVENYAAAAIETQIAALPARKPRGAARVIVASIKGDWSAPDGPRAAPEPIAANAGAYCAYSDEAKATEPVKATEPEPDSADKAALRARAAAHVEACLALLPAPLRLAAEIGVSEKGISMAAYLRDFQPREWSESIKELKRNAG